MRTLDKKQKRGMRLIIVLAAARKAGGCGLFVHRLLSPLGAWFLDALSAETDVPRTRSGNKGGRGP